VDNFEIHIARVPPNSSMTNQQNAAEIENVKLHAKTNKIFASHGNI
jgi:hypothetical protein